MRIRIEVREEYVDNYFGPLVFKQLGPCGTTSSGTISGGTISGGTTSSGTTNSATRYRTNNSQLFITLWLPMSTMTNTILSILKEASVSVLEIYEDVDRFEKELKADQSPLTAADKKSNQIIIERLSEYYPAIPVISEESKQALYKVRSAYERYFLVDPLDGTKEFIKRNGEFTINIAYMEGHHPVGGFVFVPCTGLAYMAEKGNGAYRIDDANEKTVIRSKPFFLMDDGLQVVASRSHRDQRTEEIISRLQNPDIVSIGSSLKFLLIADGKAHFYPRFAPTMEWDTAAAQCILEEAGGSVIHTETLNPLVYNKPDLTNPYFMAMGALLDPESLFDLK